MTDLSSPRVTVVSAWYNRTQGLEESVRSLLDQEGVDFEFIIIDDCSTDETANKLAALDHPRLRVLRNARNMGFTRTICRAVDEARGDYVALHGAGDLSLPNRLAAQTAFLDAHPDHVAVGTGVIAHDLATGRRIRQALPPPTSGKTPYTHGEVMFRRTAYEAVGGYRWVFQYSQDSDLWRRLGEIGRLGRVEDPLYERRSFADGVSVALEKQLLQAVFSNLGTYAAQERMAGRRDPVDKVGAAALLTQSRTPRIPLRMTPVIKQLLRERRFSEVKSGLETVPLGLIGWKMLMVYVLLAPFFRKPALRPVPPVETWREDNLSDEKGKSGSAEKGG